MLIERFQCAFATDGIAQQHDHKVNEVVMTKPTPGEAYPLFNRRKRTQALQCMRDYRRFSKPGFRHKFPDRFR